MGISMSSNFERVQILQVELANVEHSTGQHDWQNIPVADAPRHDGELSRRGHSAKIAVAVASRLVDAVRCLFTLLQETSMQFHDDISQSCLQNRLVGFDFDQLLYNLRYQLHLRQADIEFLQRRADNQVSAVSNVTVFIYDLFQRLLWMIEFAFLCAVQSTRLIETAESIVLTADYKTDIQQTFSEGQHAQHLNRSRLKKYFRVYSAR
jgi:hypothetical protein